MVRCQLRVRLKGDLGKQLEGLFFKLPLYTAHDLHHATDCCNHHYHLPSIIININITITSTLPSSSSSHRHSQHSIITITFTSPPLLSSLFCCHSPSSLLFLLSPSPPPLLFSPPSPTVYGVCIYVCLKHGPFMQPRLASHGVPVSASQMLRSQACLTTPGSQGFPQTHPTLPCTVSL